MKRLLIVLSLVLAATSVTAQAQPYGPRGFAPSAQRYGADTPAAIVRGAIAKLAAFARSANATDRVAAMALLERDVAPYIDFDTITRSAAGPLYRQMSPTRRNELRGRIKEHFLTTLAAGLLSYQTRNIRVVPGGRRAGSRRSVTVWVNKTRGPATRLDFRFYRSKAGWTVYDVVANGRSVTLFYRGLIRRMSARR